MARFDLADFEWSVIQPLLPTKSRDVARVDERQVLNGILLAAAHRRAMGGHSSALRPAYDLRDSLQPVAQGRRVGSHSIGGFKGLRWRHPNDRLLVDPRASACGQWSKKQTRSRCMGRSRGGLTTKIHALVDACGLPIILKITEGQAHDGRSAQDMIDTVGRGDVLLADRAYDSNALRQTLAARGARANVKPMPNRVMALRFNRRLYRKRNLVERFFNKIKHYRAVATRYDKRDDNFLATIKLASIRIWLRFNESMT
jgi:transposase